MSLMLKILGWTLRVSSLICITYIVVGVAQGRVTSLPELLGSLAYHVAFAVGGVLAVRQGSRLSAPKTTEQAAAA